MSGLVTETLAFTPSPAQRPRIRSLTAGDLRGLQREIARALDRFDLSRHALVRSCYEAGRDGFWLHRWLVAHGVENLVVDSSSIEVNRRARRAKTDRLDVGKLLSLLLRWAGGEPRVWSVVHVPTPDAEAARQVTREIETVRQDRQRLRNRLQGLLATQGIRGALTRGAARLEQLETGDGRPLPAIWRARLAREWAQLQAIEARLRTLRAERTAAVAQADARVAEVAGQIARLRGFAETGATILQHGVVRDADLPQPQTSGALLGLVPVPYRSDQTVRDQGISKAASGELRGSASSSPGVGFAGSLTVR